MSRDRCIRNFTASGLAREKDAYKHLLVLLSQSGCTLHNFQTKPLGWLGTMIQYTVLGTEEQIDTFRDGEYPLARFID